MCTVSFIGLAVWHKSGTKFWSMDDGGLRSATSVESHVNHDQNMQACRGYVYPWIYPWILRWHNTTALNLCKIPASYKLLTNCTFLMIICFNYLLLCIFITISERNACMPHGRFDMTP